MYVAQCFMTMCVSALALTSLDSVARIGRMSFQELFSTDDMEQAEHWRQVVCNKYFATMITLACGFILTKSDIPISGLFWKRQSAFECSGSHYAVRLFKGYGQRKQNAVPSAYYHALRYLLPL